VSNGGHGNIERTFGDSWLFEMDLTLLQPVHIFAGLALLAFAFINILAYYSNAGTAGVCGPLR
jgi:hypothetical protein